MPLPKWPSAPPHRLHPISGWRAPHRPLRFRAPRFPRLQRWAAPKRRSPTSRGARKTMPQRLRRGVSDPVGCRRRRRVSRCRRSPGQLWTPLSLRRSPRPLTSRATCRWKRRRQSARPSSPARSHLNWTDWTDWTGGKAQPPPCRPCGTRMTQRRTAQRAARGAGAGAAQQWLVRLVRQAQWPDQPDQRQVNRSPRVRPAAAGRAMVVLPSREARAVTGRRRPPVAGVKVAVRLAVPIAALAVRLAATTVVARGAMSAATRVATTAALAVPLVATTAATEAARVATTAALAALKAVRVAQVVKGHPAATTAAPVAQKAGRAATTEATRAGTSAGEARGATTGVVGSAVMTPLALDRPPATARWASRPRIYSACKSRRAGGTGASVRVVAAVADLAGRRGGKAARATAPSGDRPMPGRRSVRQAGLRTVAPARVRAPSGAASSVAPVRDQGPGGVVAVPSEASGQSSRRGTGGVPPRGVWGWQPG